MRNCYECGTVTAHPSCCANFSGQSGCANYKAAEPKPAPTWLEEFGDTKDGRKKLAHELVEGKRVVECRSIDMDADVQWCKYEITGVPDWKAMQFVMNGNGDLSRYRFAPEAGQ